MFGIFYQSHLFHSILTMLNDIRCFNFPHAICCAMGLSGKAAIIVFTRCLRCRKGLLCLTINPACISSALATFSCRVICCALKKMRKRQWNYVLYYRFLYIIKSLCNKIAPRVGFFYLAIENFAYCYISI